MSLPTCHIPGYIVKDSIICLYHSIRLEINFCCPGHCQLLISFQSLLSTTQSLISADVTCSLYFQVILLTPILKHNVSEWDEFTKQYRFYDNPSLNLISHLATLFYFTAHQFCFLTAENTNTSICFSP